MKKGSFFNVNKIIIILPCSKGAWNLTSKDYINIKKKEAKRGEKYMFYFARVCPQKQKPKKESEKEYGWMDEVR